MICNLCRRLEAPINKRYCPRCGDAMNEVWPAIEADAIRQAEAAAIRLRRTTAPSLAEEVTPLVEIFWQPGEVIKALRDRMRLSGLDRALIHLPGADTFSDAMLRTISAVTYYRVSRALDPDTLFVEAISESCRSLPK